MDEFDLLTAKEVGEKDPNFIISFYESNSRIVKKVEERKKLLEYPEYTSETQIPEIEDEPDAAAEESTEAANETVEGETDTSIQGGQGDEQQQSQDDDGMQEQQQQQVDESAAEVIMIESRNIVSLIISIYYSNSPMCNTSRTRATWKVVLHRCHRCWKTSKRRR